VEAWRVLPAPEFGSARLALARPNLQGSDYRIEDLATAPAVGDHVRICLSGPVSRILFDGRITKHLARVGPDVETISLEAEDTLCERLGGSVVGRWRSLGAMAVQVPAEKCVFNDEREGLASPTKFWVNSRQCKVFQSGPSGRLWSVADILEYLLAAHVPADLAVPASAELEALAGTIYPRRTNVAGLSVAEALAKAAAAAGLSVRGCATFAGGMVKRGLVFYRPGKSGRRRAVRLQRHGEALDLRRSNLWKGSLTLKGRPARRGVLCMGDLKRYESTFELKAGWDPALESHEYRKFVRSDTPDWLAMANVFRRWVLNESGDYSGAPFNLDAFDFSSLSEEDFLVSKPRRFWPCLSVGEMGRSLGVVVEISYDGGQTWRRYGGPVRVSADQCAVYLADDALAGEYFQAARGHAARVRVTASVDADRRLSVQVNGDPGCGVEVVELPGAKWAKVHPESIFYECGQLPPAVELDDTNRLIQLAQSLSRSESGAAEAEITLGVLDVSCNVGDIIERIEGRELGLVTFPGAAPFVRTVEHRCGEEWTTHLTVSG